MKANLKQVTKYTEEEKIQMFKEGHIRSLTPRVKKSKKAYSRKDKSWKNF